ncbi:restriction endonuclease subunit S [Paenibacillus odorifer]|uniref:restriction endonuclease subunit S n=1 Tax=Paenibacillus odorifer TaxID=189426 RepID=UPI00096E9C4A|nr:restriction endonuclease subunit S [Paenibacillus odorifer]OMD06641.1 hypothetical protein BJP47_13650 [Paenibacillus odorifer]
MNVQDLKNSILQLAIQGKLVEQRDEEDTAKLLLDQFKVEKEQLIKEKKIKNETRLPEITDDEIPFDIPESWEWVRLINIVSTLGDGIHGTPNYDTMGEYYFINGNNLTDGNIDIKDNTKRINSEEYMKHKKNLNDNTVLVSINGTIGNVAFYNNEKVILGKSACYFNLLSEELKFYLYWVIKTKYFLDYAVRNATGSTIKNVSLATMKKFLVPIPPLEEQKRIVAKIEALMPYVEKYGEAHSKLELFNKKFPEDMQKSILQYAIQGKLVDQRDEEGTAEALYQHIEVEKEKLIKEGKIKKEKLLPAITEDEIPFDIPDSWKWVRLGGITHNWGQKVPNRLFDYIDVASVDNVNGCLSKNENLVQASDAPSRARKIVQEGSVLYSTVRPYLLNICIVDKPFKHEPIASTAFAVLHPYEGIYEKFLYYVLRSPMFISYVSSVMIGVAYPAINDANLLAGLIPLPPLEEQKRIVTRIEELLPFCQQLVK